MKAITKWLMILGGGLILVVITLALIVPMFVDGQKYRPTIENLISEATARPFKLEGNLRLSLFPWASIAVSNVHLENPPGFEEKDFISVASFDVQVKLIPLVFSFFKDIRIKSFNLKGVRLVLETTNDGRSNWEGLGKSATEAHRKTKKEDEQPSEHEPEGVLPIQALAVGEFTITEGVIVFIDHSKGERFQVSDLKLHLKQVSPGHSIPIDLSFNALKQLNVKLKGSIADAASNPRFNMSIETSSFSPRKLMAAMGREFPMITADPNALEQISVMANLKGDIRKVSISHGIIKLDESTINFSGEAWDFSKPVMTFDMKLDEIDLDRYLPPKTDKKSKEESAKAKKERSEGPASGPQKTDYTPLRNLVLNGAIQIGKLKAANATVQDLTLKLSGKNGVFDIDPLSLALYQGNLSIKGTLDVKADMPESALSFEARGINVGPLIKDIADKDILEGNLKGDMTLGMKGDNSESIKQSLNGKGMFIIEDGAVKGLDLAAMVRNTDGAYGFAGKGKDQRKTEFRELRIPFTITNGVLYTDDTRMESPLLHLQAAGNADLLKETLNFRIETAFVTTKKEDKEKMKNSEVGVPVLVTGSLYDPKFHPDLKGLAEQKLEEKVFKSKQFKKIFEKEEMKPFEEDTKKFLKGIFE